MMIMNKDVKYSNKVYFCLQLETTSQIRKTPRQKVGFNNKLSFILGMH